MTSSEIKENNIIPFEIEDKELQLLFSFFLHIAPTIESNLALKSNKKENKMWNSHINNWKSETYKFYPPNSNVTNEEKFKKCNLTDNVLLNHETRGFVCIKKYNYETEFECFIRHLRNAIAHGYVYMKKQPNRIFLLFEDYNKCKNKSSIILFSKSDLKKLKKDIMTLYTLNGVKRKSKRN